MGRGGVVGPALQEFRSWSGFGIIRRLEISWEWGAERNLYSRRVEFRGDRLRAVRRWGKNSTSGSWLAGATDFFLW